MATEQETIEPIVKVRLDMLKSDHELFTQHQLRLSAKKKRKLTQEETFSEILKGFKS